MIKSKQLARALYELSLGHSPTGEAEDKSEGLEKKFFDFIKQMTQFLKNADRDKLFKEKTIYVVSPVKGYCPEFILDNYNFEKAGVLHRVVEKQSEEIRN